MLHVTATTYGPSSIDRHVIDDASPTAITTPTAINRVLDDLTAREPQAVRASREDFIETDTGNRISRHSVICGSQNIILGGKTTVDRDAIIRGDLRRAGGGHVVSVSIGRYCAVESGALLRPPCKTYRGIFSYYPMRVGDWGRFAIIKEYAVIMDGAVIAPHTVVPAFSVYAGTPARCVGELPEATPEIIEELAMREYEQFKLA